MSPLFYVQPSFFHASCFITRQLIFSRGIFLRFRENSLNIKHLIINRLLKIHTFHNPCIYKLGLAMSRVGSRSGWVGGLMGRKALDPIRPVNLNKLKTITQLNLMINGSIFRLTRLFVFVFFQKKKNKTTKSMLQSNSSQQLNIKPLHNHMLHIVKD